MNFIKRLFGWSECLTFPRERCVMVIIHTSYWDIFAYFLYKISSYGSNVCTLVQPKLKQWYYTPFTYMLNCIYAPPNEHKNSNSIQHIVNEMKQMGDNAILCMSPKGTCSKREWRSGYYYIAKQLQCKIYPLCIDYSERRIIIGEPVDPCIVDLGQSTNLLQEQLRQYTPLYNELSEIDINATNYCPYESLLPFDFCALSTFAFLPCVFTLFVNEQYYRGTASLITVLFAYYYHLQCEGSYFSYDWILPFQKIEGYMAKLCILSHIIENLYVYGKLEPIFYMSFIVGLFFYANSIPRGTSVCRGKYTIFHSCYHILTGIAGYSLATQKHITYP